MAKLKLKTDSLHINKQNKVTEDSKDFYTSRFFYGENKTGPYDIRSIDSYFISSNIPNTGEQIYRTTFADELKDNPKAMQAAAEWFNEHPRRRTAVIHNLFNKEPIHAVPIGEVLDEVADKLNPDLWDSDKELRPEVREKIVDIVDKFKESLTDDDIKLDIKDIVIVGSNANYNYSKDSDIDAHIVANMDVYKGQEDLAEKLYMAYKSIFNDKYDPLIRGHEVEVYVEPDKLNVHSNGMYSLNNGWISMPQKDVIPDIDITDQLQIWVDKYNDVMKNPTVDAIDKLRDDIHLLRQNSILNDGEYGEGNLVFKALRNEGYIQRLKDKKIELLNKEMSLDEGLLNEERDFSVKVDIRYDGNPDNADTLDADYNYIRDNLHGQAWITDDWWDELTNSGGIDLVIEDPKNTADIIDNIENSTRAVPIGESLNESFNIYLNPLIPNELSNNELISICYTHADNLDWYVIHYDWDVGVTNQWSPYMTLKDAYNLYITEQPANGSERIELVFSPDPEQDFEYGENIIVANKGSHSVHDQIVNVILGAIPIGESLDEDFSTDELNDLHRLLAILNDENSDYYRDYHDHPSFDEFINSLNNGQYDTIPLAYSTIGDNDQYEVSCWYNIPDRQFEYEVYGKDDFNGAKHLTSTEPYSLSQFVDYIENTSWEDVFDDCYRTCYDLLLANCDYDIDSGESLTGTFAIGED